MKLQLPDPDQLMERRWWQLTAAPLAMAYGLMLRVRNYAYDRGWLKVYRAPVPVISIGNISAGGTGKTPLAEYLLRSCEALGLRAAYLSRGYGRRTKGYLEVRPGPESVRLFGDEACQVADKFPDIPVAVAESRAEGIQRLLESHAPQLIILDDAFQHRRVARDLELLLIDASRLPGRDRLLPAGRLREPTAGMARADLFVVNKLNDPARMDRIREELQGWHKPVAFCRPEQEAARSFWGTEGKAEDVNTAIAFSGLGNNTYFFNQLRENGWQLSETFPFPDHYTYTEKDLRRIAAAWERLAAAGGGLVLTTEKDYFRLRGIPWLDRFRQLPLCYLPMRLHWLEGEQLIQNAVKTLSAGPFTQG